MLDDLNDFIFSPDTPFETKALKVFNFQYRHNDVYKRFADNLNCNPSLVNTINEIPFLPVSFFKTHKIVSTDFLPEAIFKSSGTTIGNNSQHFVKETVVYEASFLSGFEQFYGRIQDYCILGLLPSYLEREGSSLVYMVERMMHISNHPLNGLHLYDHDRLADKLKKLEERNEKTILIGVTYALLDFAQKYPMPLKNTIIMETGGMKGKNKEMVRGEVHLLLKKAFGLHQVHSEYGMTELLSQAYSMNDGIFKAPPWMKVLIREEDDPLRLNSVVLKSLTGVINVIDLANIYSCSFIATDDVGKLHKDGSFEVLGRLDYSDIRGCSLMVL
jgi:hypothetical protein